MFEPTADIALVVPLHGSAGMFGPSCELCAELATAELNAERGVLGRELRLRVVDGSGEPARVAADVARLVDKGTVDAVVGWHISAVRRAIAPRIAGRVPYVYTALYEGGERTPGVFLAGETPSRQLLPAMRWLTGELGVRRWCIVGNDYVWPRITARWAHRYAAECGVAIEHERFVPLGTREFGDVMRELERVRPDAVLMLLVGDDAACFNRAFARAGFDRSCVRLSTLMDENILLASGAHATRGVWTAAAYFETLMTAESLAFGLRYAERFGSSAPALNSMGESCYEGMRLLVALAERARSLDPAAIVAAAEGTTYGGPRGEVHVRDSHLDQPVHLSRAAGLEFDIVATL